MRSDEKSEKKIGIWSRIIRHPIGNPTPFSLKSFTCSSRNRRGSFAHFTFSTSRLAASGSRPCGRGGASRAGCGWTAASCRRARRASCRSRRGPRSRSSPLNRSKIAQQEPREEVGRHRVGDERRRAGLVAVLGEHVARERAAVDVERARARRSTAPEPCNPTSNSTHARWKLSVASSMRSTSTGSSGDEPALRPCSTTFSRSNAACRSRKRASPPSTQTARTRGARQHVLVGEHAREEEVALHAAEAERARLADALPSSSIRAMCVGLVERLGLLPLDPDRPAASGCPCPCGCSARGRTRPHPAGAATRPRPSRRSRVAFSTSSETSRSKRDASVGTT